MSEESKLAEVLRDVRAMAAEEVGDDAVEVVLIVRIRRIRYRQLSKSFVKKLKVLTRTHRVEGHDDYEQFDIIVS